MGFYIIKYEPCNFPPSCLNCRLSITPSLLLSSHFKVENVIQYENCLFLYLPPLAQVLLYKHFTATPCCSAPSPITCQPQPIAIQLRAGHKKVGYLDSKLTQWNISPISWSAKLGINLNHFPDYFSWWYKKAWSVSCCKTC